MEIIDINYNDGIIKVLWKKDRRVLETTGRALCLDGAVINSAGDGEITFTLADMTIKELPRPVSLQQIEKEFGRAVILVPEYTNKTIDILENYGITAYNNDKERVKSASELMAEFIEISPSLAPHEREEIIDLIKKEIL